MAFSNESGGSARISDEGESKTHKGSQDCRVFFGSAQPLIFPDRDDLTECCVGLTAARRGAPNRAARSSET